MGMTKSMMAQCTYSVPSSGNNSITANSGTICDPGGAGNYPNNANGYTVINPVGAGLVVLTFTSFYLEGCCDYVRVYDGVGLGGTLLYQGNGQPNPLPGPFTSTSGSLTVQFTSDGSVVYSGFSANITNLSLVPSITSFTPSSGCSGQGVVVINGSGFLGTTVVKIGGTDVQSFVVDGNNKITAVVGPGTTGVITVTNPNGTATSVGTFTVNPSLALPTVTASDTIICLGASVTLNGVSPGNEIGWYSTPTGPTQIAATLSGVDYVVTPSVTTTYYVQAQEIGGVAPGSQTFNYTGGVQTFTVPAGVTSITIDAYGAAGGKNALAPESKGGNIKASISVTPGQTLNVYVGGKGNQGPSAPGGYNGGGASSNTSNGGSGGGASDVRTTPYSLADRIIVAGGGGGAGYNCNNNTERGGHGGGLIGETGYQCSMQTDYVGIGGSQVAGGAMGNNQGQGCGTNGTLGIGGNGACTYGGGGGGGYYGGGGGGYGGGGGGSSFAAGTIINNYQGVRDGNGMVVISWDGSGCPSPTRVPVTVYVAASPAAAPVSVSANPSTICPGGTSNLKSISTPAGTEYWYADSIGGTPFAVVPSGTNVAVTPSVTTTYYVSATEVVPGGNQTFNYTGAMDSLTVPAGVTQVTINAFGAEGVGVGFVPGKGGRAQGKMNVTPGQKLYIFVGGQNGYNGGGLGKGIANGGGASDVRTGGKTLADRVIVAGGGGGAGGDNWNCNVGSGNGGGGTPVGSNFVGGAGGAGYTSGTGCGTDGANVGGNGGTGTHGGGGGGGGLTSGGIGANASGNAAQNGSLGVGGNAFMGLSCVNVGGGGGGYYGGGGAAGNNCGAGRGGGGSSWTGTLSDPVFQGGVRSGNGQITISWGETIKCQSTPRTPVTVNIESPITGTSLATPSSICIGDSSVISGSVPTVCPGGSVTDFTGTYDAILWPQTNLNSNGTVDISLAPTSISLTSGTNLSGQPGKTRIKHHFTCAGTVSFNWSYSHPNVLGSIYDYPEYAINGGTPALMNGFVMGGANSQSGSQTISVNANDTLYLIIATLDNDATAGTVSISGFSAPTPAIGGTATIWDAPVGGNNLGTSSITVTPATPGTSTYYIEYTSLGLGCVNPVRDTVELVTHALPTVTASPASQTVCENDTATVAGGGAATYTWTGGITDNTPFVVTGNNTYTVTGTDANGCSNTATAVVNMNTAPTVTASISPATTCNQTSAT
ncbi:MAG: hypothetical protein LC096_08970, partial [Bacteroidia bacterium]|nr:hypothetical protein [Bacteroidia bacterium]